MNQQVNMCDLKNKQTNKQTAKHLESNFLMLKRLFFHSDPSRHEAKVETIKTLPVANKETGASPAESEKLKVGENSKSRH